MCSGYIYFGLNFLSMPFYMGTHRYIQDAYMGGSGRIVKSYGSERREGGEGRSQQKIERSRREGGREGGGKGYSYAHRELEWLASNAYNAQLVFVRELPGDLIQVLLFTLAYALNNMTP